VPGLSMYAPLAWLVAWLVAWACRTVLCPCLEHWFCTGLSATALLFAGLGHSRDCWLVDTVQEGCTTSSAVVE